MLRARLLYSRCSAVDISLSSTCWLSSVILKVVTAPTSRRCQAARCSHACRVRLVRVPQDDGTRAVWQRTAGVGENRASAVTTCAQKRIRFNMSMADWQTAARVYRGSRGLAAVSLGNHSPSKRAAVGARRGDIGRAASCAPVVRHRLPSRGCGRQLHTTAERWSERAVGLWRVGGPRDGLSERFVSGPRWWAVWRSPGSPSGLRS